jgi:SNF2 family DNA or RNA helicase
LALILSNPAPALPISGSNVPDEFDAHDGGGLGWDPDLKTRINESAPDESKRGSILSRGTLVVCHVSLVGQWCEEAKSKLQDPGLIYPYHGSTRKRDSKLLAENSIVVTTYATLSSDKNYHAKGQDTSYCPPCEQVRWWRIICDESHTMRTSSTKQSHAVAALVSDHTWCVTGTPVSTSLNDLSNQLKLVGIEHVAEYFEIFRNTVMKTINDRSKTKDRGRSNTHKPDNRLFGHFLFFMRSLMIRHTKTQKYLGTDTDLMALPAKVRVAQCDDAVSYQSLLTLFLFTDRAHH